MKALLVAAVLFATGSAHAGNWIDSGCRLMFVTEKDGIYLTDFKAENPKQAGCAYVAASTIECSDGKQHRVEIIPDDGILIDGVALYPPVSETMCN